jgi:Glycosyl hydrolase family 81 C-terminal domain
MNEDNSDKTKIQVGEAIEGWEGLEKITPYLHLSPPPVDETNPKSRPNLSKYPNVVGGNRLSVTQPDQGSMLPARIRKRSWMGWFLWGDGAPPPGVSAGYPVAETEPPKYHNDNWDFYSWQYSAGEPISSGQWKAVRLDQQPLYLNPIRLNYNWPCGKFGYQTAPLKRFADNLGYWSSKKIVRGPNLSLAFPYFVEYAERVDEKSAPNYPDAWRNSWLYMRTRPLETLVMVPSNKTPVELLENGAWNKVDGGHEPFPYPVWDEKLSPPEQTPWNIKVDRMGDWDADLIWEGTHPAATDYQKNRYQKTAWKEAGKGNYLKMTVGQGSPYVWCETNNSRYAIFYNLIRTNEKDHLDDAGGTRSTQAGVLSDPGSHICVWDVPGVEGVQYVLLYGNQTNPNQFYHEVEPFKWDKEKGVPGGWNPPGAQSNHTYLAVYFKKDAVTPVSLQQNCGVDPQGNLYFFLDFRNVKEGKGNQKNWYVVGAVPVMHYYHPEVKEDDEPARVKAAHIWAEELGKYAFNFLTGTTITFEVRNMYKVKTTYRAALQNPYQALGDKIGNQMTPDSWKTVIAVMPHHYQPITLGPDSTREGTPDVVWNPFRTTGYDFPTGSIELPNANRTDQKSPSYWGYWGPRGNQKAIVAGEFTTEYPFQNFLPVTPPPKWDKEYDQSGVQAVRITEVGTGYEKLPTDEEIPKESDLPAAQVVSRAGGWGARLKVILEPYTDRIMQIDVIDGGGGYPDGNPPADAAVQINGPDVRITGSRQATARVQIGGGKVLAVFMIDKGAGYRSTIHLKPAAGSKVLADPPLILPIFASDGKQLEKGFARVITGGAGWVASDKAPEAEVRGTGVGAKAEIVRPGEIIRIADPGIGGYTGRGTYPSTGDPQEDAKKIKVHLPPSKSGQRQQARIGSIEPMNSYFKTVITDPGEGYSEPPIGYFVLEDGQEIKMINVILSEQGGVITADPERTDFRFDKPKAVSFRVQEDAPAPAGEAQAMLLPGFSVASVLLQGEACSGYQDDLEIAFSGGEVGRKDLVMPELDFDIENGEVRSVRVKNKGKGFHRDGFFTIEGGKGFNAALRPVLSEGSRGELIAVKVMRAGSNYGKKIRAYTDPGKKELEVEISQDGKKGILNVRLRPDVDYSGFDTIPSIFLTAADGDALDYVNFPAKGHPAKIAFSSDAAGGITNIRIEAGEGYLPDTANQSTAESLPAIPRFSDLGQVASPNQAYGFIAEVAKPKVKVEQVLYDSLISRFSTMAAKNLRPFGGSFGGASGPDGYGLGNNLSAAAKVLGILYNLQQHYTNGKDLPSVTPSLFAVREADNTANKFEFPIYARNHPLLTLSGSLKTMTQALQRTITLFFQGTPYANQPSAKHWKMAYFSQYDKAGRVVVNPTATIPVYGVVSSVIDPPAIPDAENQNKVGLDKWTGGMLWSGFGVSDQWNDQHYFYGYYLSVAALLAVLDGAWLKELSGRPQNVWADERLMGTAIDQWMKTLAYDPSLEDQYYDYSQHCRKAGVTYEKYAYFDQWNGHPWATGASPGRAGDVEDGKNKPLNPWSRWHSYGTGNYPYDDENENSTWEGNQAWSAILLWGGATGRKSIVNQGIYLLATGNAASDLYFLDKNYNLKRGAQNKYTWCPVTTGQPASGQGGNNSYPLGTGYVDSNPEAFYGEASAGCSILHKGSPSLNNFFYSYPTGSKFIQAFPPTPWTMGISRNLGYMKKWAEAMIRPEWREARDSSLFQPGNWLGMAMTSALCDTPYNPGDDPKTVRPYVERLWSSWVAYGQPAGDQATMQPADQPTSVLSLLHTLDFYGPPDWTIYAKVVDRDGKDSDGEILFTAAFARQNHEDPAKVDKSLVVFNPGWETRFVNFYSIATDGTLGLKPLNEKGPIEARPKKMTVVVKQFGREGKPVLPPDPVIQSIAVLTDGTLVGIGSVEQANPRLFTRPKVGGKWEARLDDGVKITDIGVFPVAVTVAVDAGHKKRRQDALLGVSEGVLYTRETLGSSWERVDNTKGQVSCIAIKPNGAIVGMDLQGRLLERANFESDWVTLTEPGKPMKSIALLADGSLLGIGRDGEEAGRLFVGGPGGLSWIGISGFDKKFQSIAVQPNGLIFGLGTDGTIETLSIFGNAPLPDHLLLDNLRDEIDVFLEKINNNLDYFGNPVGWVPRLSALTNLEILKNTQSVIVKILYFANSLQLENQKAEEATTQLKFVVDQLNQEIKMAQTNLVTAYSRLDEAKIECDAIDGEVRTKTTQLRRLNDRIVLELKDEAADQAIFTGALKLASGLLHLIPVGQPYLGEIGGGLLDNISKIDIYSDNPLGESFKTMSGIADDLSTFIQTNKEQLTNDLTSPLTRQIDSAQAGINTSDSSIKEYKSALGELDTALENKFGSELETLRDGLKEINSIKGKAGFAERKAELDFIGSKEWLSLYTEGEEIKQRIKKIEGWNAKKKDDILSKISALEKEKPELLAKLKGFELKKKNRTKGIEKAANYMKGVGKGIAGVGDGLQTMMTRVDEESAEFRKKIQNAKNGKFKKEFEDLYAEIDLLSLRKLKAAQILMKLQGVIQQSSQNISANLIAAAAFTDQRSEATEQQLNHLTKLFLETVIQDTRELLLAEVYYLVKSYQYRFVEKVEGNVFDTQNIIDDIVKFLTKKDKGIPTESDYTEAFKMVIQAKLIKLALSLLTGRLQTMTPPGKNHYNVTLTNQTVRSDGVKLLEQLNQKRKVVFKLHELGNVDSKGNGADMYYRIEDIVFKSIEIKLSEEAAQLPNIEKRISFSFGIKHSGDSIIRAKDGNYYYFTTRSQELGEADDAAEKGEQNVKAWTANYNGAEATDTVSGVTNDEGSTTDWEIWKGLLSAIETDIDSVVYSEHLSGATSELTLFIAENNLGVDFEITKLVFDFSYEKLRSVRSF